MAKDLTSMTIDTPRTIETYLKNHETEFRNNGYDVLRGKTLLELRKKKV
jgi:hypothetical protein